MFGLSNGSGQLEDSPLPAFLNFMWPWLKPRLPGLWRMTRWLLILAAMGHLALVAFFPGGKNPLWNIPASGALAYTSYFQPVDPLGFWLDPRRDVYLAYKVYTQEGTVHHGTFPDPLTSPQVRYNRWSQSVLLFDEGGEPLAVSFSNYIANSMASRPFRIELSLARRSWVLYSPKFPPPAPWGDSRASTVSLGSYDGLTNQWLSRQDRSAP